MILWMNSTDSLHEMRIRGRGGGPKSHKFCGRLLSIALNLLPSACRPAGVRLGLRGRTKYAPPRLGGSLAFSRRPPLGRYDFSFLVRFQRGQRRLLRALGSNWASGLSEYRGPLLRPVCFDIQVGGLCERRSTRWAVAWGHGREA